MEKSLVEQLIDRYCEAWNTPDIAQRQSILQEVWATNARYTDPRADTQGIDELSTHIDNIMRTRPGAKIVRTSAIDVHHNVVRFGWRVIEADGSMLPDGIDFVEISPDGKIQRIVGFFGPLEPKT